MQSFLPPAFCASPGLNMPLVLHSGSTPGLTTTRIDAIPASIKTLVLHSDQCAFFNGVAYWIMFKEKDATDHCLLSFDTDSESNRDFRAGNDYIDMWVLQEKSFKKLLTVYLPGKWSFYPLAITMSNELLVGYPCGIYLCSYNLETKQVTETRIKLAVDCYNNYNTHTYVESLVLLRE
ncbi:unnamed protein product [Prunus armeniaca]|uniref:F-box associated domain-containing protein n=1 Tax=Prunus armeniaca TaxID=36596 RepID=A0A6J5UB68_PRUAR|nr:unnamed protein product [Prunus armeniaca]